MSSLLLSLFPLLVLLSSASAFVTKQNGSSILHGIPLPENPSVDGTNCKLRSEPVTKKSNGIKIQLLHRDQRLGTSRKGSIGVDSLLASNFRDISRIQNFHARMESQRPAKPETPFVSKQVGRGRLMAEFQDRNPRMVATLESGASVGSGEYLMDVFVGTPPRHFSLIVDTGSDLNWLQCLPCIDCFEQIGPHYDPSRSSSYRPVSCKDPSCQKVLPPDTSRSRCASHNGTCEYFYWYGDKSNTTGDLATETFTVNVTSGPSGLGAPFRLENIVFGCGHWNRGLFHGAGGLLGLGRGGLSFLSQLGTTFGRKFSYCLVDRESNATVSGSLVLGEDVALVRNLTMQFTELVAGEDSPVDTFYYVRVQAVRVGGEVLSIPRETFQIGPDGSGGTIVDSGTTLTYFPEAAMTHIKQAFLKKVKGLDRVRSFPLLDPCFDVTGVDEVELPEFSILFSDGAVWSFPADNYFIRLEPEGLICLTLLSTPQSSLSILGNYQQQNFHVSYDLDKSRLGFAPRQCSEV